jgi:hypothetical protein
MENVIHQSQYIPISMPYMRNRPNVLPPAEGSKQVTYIASRLAADHDK